MKIEQIRKILKIDDNLKGENISICVLESDINGSHALKSLETHELNKPLANVDIFDCSVPENAQLVIDGNYDIVVMSVSDSLFSLGDIMEISKKSFLITSGGNSGKLGETMRDSHGKYWFQVGAVDENLKPKYYSSWGRDMIDGATLTDIELSDSKYNGTSGSAQLYADLIAEYFEAHLNFFGVKPSINQTIDFIDKHSHNTQILDPDSDLKMGYGVLVLPEKYHFKKIEIRFAKGSNKSYNTFLTKEDGIIKTDKLLSPSKIDEGLSYIYTRDVTNLSGAFVRWNNDLRQIEMFVQQGDH